MPHPRRTLAPSAVHCATAGQFTVRQRLREAVRANVRYYAWLCAASVRPATRDGRRE